MRDDTDVYPSGYKSFKRAFAGSMRGAARLHGFRFTSGEVWRIEKGFVGACTTIPCWEKMAIHTNPGIKALESDGVAWDVLRMSSNRRERESLHVTAAFSGPWLPLDAFPLKEDVPFGSEGDAPAVAEMIASSMAECLERALSAIGTQRRFFELVRERCEREAREEGRDPAGFGYCVALIALGRVREARAVAAPTAARGSQRDLFTYGVGDKGDATLIVEYCDRLLAGEGEGHE